MKIKFNTRKSIISLILILAMCSSLFMISASALSTDSTPITLSEETLAKAIAEKKGVSVDDIEVRVVSVQQISVDELAALQNYNHASLRGASVNMAQSSACCSNPDLHNYTLEARTYTYSASYCYSWEDWSCVQCYNCKWFQALYPTGNTGTTGHGFNNYNYCVTCGYAK